MQKIDFLYKKALKEIMDNGSLESDHRLFHKEKTVNKSMTKAVAPMTIQFDMEKDGFPLISLRKINTKIFAAEAVWFLTGDNTTEKFLSKYTKIWDFFKEEDGGVTSYGHRWRSNFGRDQITGVLEMLKIDSSSRHGVVMTWDPREDSLTNGKKRKNVPCQVGFMINVTDGKLNFHSIWRSVDMILGFPSDIPGNTLLAYIFAKYLGVGLGTYTHYIANAHIYDIHFDIAKTLIDREPKQDTMNIDVQENWFDRASSGDHSLVDEIIAQVDSQYINYHEAIKGIKIVV